MLYKLYYVTLVFVFIVITQLTRTQLNKVCSYLVSCIATLCGLVNSNTDHMHAYMHIVLSAGACVATYMCCINVFVSVCVCACVSVWMFVCVCVSVDACVCQCRCSCVCVVCVRVHVCSYIHVLYSCVHTSCVGTCVVG